jgi:LysR family hydrogen peroxide-inducible transcriptional activator
MNIQQFQYVLAVHKHKHFELAAEMCFISQSTLSTMISKFEDEIGVRIFDRKKKPVQTTAEGLLVIEQLTVIVKEIEQLHETTQEIKGEIAGSIRLSVIPTIAPFLLPLFIQDFARALPNLEISVKEETTDEIIRKLKSREIDIGLVSIPLHDKELVEITLFREPFLFYSGSDQVPDRISVKGLNADNLCLMEEGHCMRTQVLEICNHSNKRSKHTLNFEYKAGSIDSLIRFTQKTQLSTLLPLLATLDFNAQQRKRLVQFSHPVPQRLIGLVVHRHFAKKKLLSLLAETIQRQIAPIISIKK